jgi:glycosyltransferase involved in cell wall biosynthesis
MSELPVVSIICNTYNHEKYIGEAIEGFIIQKTKFPFEILIHDDASTDGTVDIIREYENNYPHVIYPIYQIENQFSKAINIFSTYQLSRARGKYVAFCEGDDYWTDPYKLQKQVDYMDSNPEYGLVHTDNSNYLSSSGEIIISHKKLYYPNPPSGDVFEILLKKNFISSLTVIARKNILHNAVNNLNSWIPPDLLIDYTYWLEISRISKITYLNEITAMYRVSPGTFSRPNDDYDKLLFRKLRYDIIMSFTSRYNIADKIMDEFYRDYFNEYLGNLYKWKTNYQSEIVGLPSLKVLSLKNKLLYFMHYLGMPQVLFRVVEIPYYLLRKCKKYVSR